MPLLNLFDMSLLGRAKRPALDCVQANGSRNSFTFGDLEERSNKMARHLRSRGLNPGDRLAFFLVNRVEIVDLWLAGVKLGLIIVPINVLYRERELTHILGDAAPAAVVTSKDLAGHIPGGVEIWDVDELAGRASSESGARLAVPTETDTPVSLIYTSGTTGASKGAVLTHGNFASNALALVTCWQIASGDRYLAALPLFHVHGLANGLHSWLISGCHMRLLERFEHAKAAAEFEDYKPTLFFGVPTMFVRLLELPPERARAIGLNLRLAVSGSAPLPPQVLESFRDRFGHLILERYGMTETLMNSSNPYVGERRPGSVGPPLPHVSIKICDERGAAIPDGTVGELWIRGPNVCSGYWRRPDATAASFQGGWFRTGDIGCRAPDGFITLQGRASDLIISSGFNIYPREIEELIIEQPGVREAAVVGAADPVRGEVPVAYVVVEAALFDEAALQARLRSQLASFKQPRALVRVEALPRTALGKVQKHLLPAWTSKICALAVLIFLSAIFGTSAAAEPPAATLKISHQFPGGTMTQGDFRDRLCRRFAAEAEKRSGGALKFDIYPNSSLLKTQAQFAAMRKGALDFSLVPLPYASGEIQELNIGLMPGLVTSYDQAARWKEAEVGRALARLLAAKGVLILSWVWQAGGISSRGKPVVLPQDARGLKIRGGSREMDLVYKAAGAAVTALPSNELYAAMQTGAIDAAITSSTSSISFRLEEVSHSFVGGGGRAYWFMLEPLMMSKAVFDRLPADQRSAILAAGAAVEELGRAGAEEDDAAVAVVYGKVGAAVKELTDSDVAQWRELARTTAWKDFASRSESCAQLLSLAQQVP